MEVFNAFLQASQQVYYLERTLVAMPWSVLAIFVVFMIGLFAGLYFAIRREVRKEYSDRQWTSYGP